MRAADIRGDGDQSIGHRNIPASSADRVRYPAWTEREIARCVFRTALFRRRGMTEREAEAWASRLADRDHDRDDRRICAECKHLRPMGACAVRGIYVRDTLQRCPLFTFETPAR